MGEELWLMMQGILVDVMVGILIIALYYLLSCIKGWASKLRVQTEGIKDENFRKLLEAALGRIDHLAEITVAGIEGKIGKELREQVKNGELDRKELYKLAKQAFSEIIGMLEPKYEEVLRKSIGDLDVYIDHLIEAKLEQIKLESLGGGKRLSYGY